MKCPNPKEQPETTPGRSAGSLQEPTRDKGPDSSPPEERMHCHRGEPFWRRETQRAAPWSLLSHPLALLS